MDHMMPEMDGIEATARIRLLENKKHIPIVALTANAVSGSREMFLENGFNDFLSKPVNTKKLNSVLEKWIPVEKQKKYTETAVEQNTVELTIEGIDVKKGISMMRGNVSGFIQVLSVFYKDGFEKLSTLKECLETGNIQLFTIHIHALKSASANIGAMEIAENALKLEKAGHNNDLSYINSAIPDFYLKLETLLGNIDKAVPVNK
jgi:CheY-like chemotaxis protein